MPKTEQQQTKEALEAARNIAIFLTPTPSTDALVGALVLQNRLQKNGAQVTIISEGFKPNEKQQFLMNNVSVSSKLELRRPAFIELDTEQYPVSDLSYNKDNGKLSIILSPKEGFIPNNAFTISSGKYEYDLIVTLNTPELATLGNLYYEQKTFFEEIPIVNIDYRAENEQYGQINQVELTASSTSEMLYHLFFDAGQTPSKREATLLLAGIMDATHAFRNQQLTSQTLDIVSKLLEAGANHQDLVNNLYRTKTVGLLRLWGHTLDNLQADRELALAWSLVPHSVFTATGTSEQDIQELMDEVLSHTPEAKTVILFVEAEQANVTKAHIQTTPPMDAKFLLKNWQAVGSTKRASANIQTPLSETEKNVIPPVKERLAAVLKK